MEFSIGETWTQIRPPGGPTTVGFGNLETAFQYQLLKNAPHELAVLLGLIVDWGGTGATNAGLGTSYGTLTPTVYFGKGFGDLPDTAGWIRPFALTGQAGYRDSHQFLRSGPGRPNSSGDGLRRIAAI